MFKVPEMYRLKKGAFASDASYGNQGVFIIPEGRFKQIRVIASDGEGWEHCSVGIMENGKSYMPTWDEMNKVKDLFWGPEDCVVQFHPPKSEYVNSHPYILHLWRECGKNIKTPNTDLIGIK